MINPEKKVSKRRNLIEEKNNDTFWKTILFFQGLCLEIKRNKQIENSDADLIITSKPFLKVETGNSTKIKSGTFSCK